MGACRPRPLDIRPALTDDLPAIARLLDEAGAWLRSQAITDQWPEQFVLADLAQRIELGELHIAYQDTTPVGTFALDHHADPDFWHDDSNGTRACYLDRLAVTRSHAGRGLGALLIDHAANLAAHQDRLWLRLDCAKHNTRLHAYYRLLGFEHVRTVDLPHRKSGALFQRQTRPATKPHHG